jgi:hypothetical protein
VNLESLTHAIINGIVTFFADLLMPLMLLAFAVSVFFRVVIFFNIRRGHWFAREFAKRIDNFVDSHQRDQDTSFYMVAKKLMEKTFYELFIVRSIMMRRKPDYVASLMDRIFLIQHGTARLVKDLQKQFRNLRYSEDSQPNFTEISIHVMEANPAYNRIFGVFPASFFNDVLNTMPGIFIVSGIFGTFLGIMKALPDLGGLDFADIERSKVILDGFLLKVSFSMSTSILGIILSVLSTLVNTVASPQKMFVSTVNRLNNCLVLLWHISNSNQLPQDMKEFDENRDPMEALAEQSLDKEIARRKDTQNMAS